MKLPYVVFGLVCVMVGILLALIVSNAHAHTFCQVQVGYGEEYPGWEKCPYGDVMLGADRSTESIICAGIAVTCE